MFGPPTSELAAGVSGLVAGGGLLVFGYLVADAVLPAARYDVTTRLGASLAGACAFSLVLMLAHMATGGGVFSNPLLVRIPTTAVALVLVVLQLSRRKGVRVWLWLGAAIAITAVIWGTPAFRMLPLTSTADTQLHNGWIRQLMNGETTPGAAITGDIPNYYPWLFHALGGLATYLTPGRNPYYALGAMQILISGGALLAWFALGRSLTQRWIGGAAGALFGALAGGFGFVLSRGADVIINPRHEEGAAALSYAGDLLFTRSYNLAFHNLAPPFPRDLAFALMATFVLLLSAAVRQRSAGAFAIAGGCLGLVGLTGGETFIASMLLAGCVAVVAWGVPRWRVAVALFIPALGFYALWLVPVAVNYARLDGFVNTTHIDPIDLPLYAIVVTWGVALPFAVYGTAVALRSLRTDPSARLILVLSVALFAALAIATVIPSILGEGFDTLGRRHRYWPLTYLAVASLAAVGAARLATAMRARPALVSAAVLVTAVAVTSPVLASVALPTKAGTEAVLVEALERDEDAVLNAIDRSPGAMCVVAAPQDISREVFSYTGYRLVLWTGSWFGTNRARIRWAGIYEHIATDAERIRDNRILVNGWGDRERWQDIVRKYEVDIVVAPADHANYRPFRDIPRHAAGDYIVLNVGRCSG